MSGKPGTTVQLDERGVAIVTIDNTARLNALSTRVMETLIGAGRGAGAAARAACGGAARGRGAGVHRRFGTPEVRLGIPSVVEAALLPQTDWLGTHAAIAFDRRHNRCGDRTRLGACRGSCSE